MVGTYLLTTYVFFPWRGSKASVPSGDDVRVRLRHPSAGFLAPVNTLALGSGSAGQSYHSSPHPYRHQSAAVGGSWLMIVAPSPIKSRRETQAKCSLIGDTALAAWA
ncbi:hypothetical protein LZ32DRAFT_29913 [Colletotrichum eremochloae]|nr:hypothetical protein LZ32DRAFT_29913 [Colletotrichum eremochloae]